MATICPLCGSAIEEGEVCSCQQQGAETATEAGSDVQPFDAQSIANELAFDMSSLSNVEGLETGAEEFSVAPLQHTTAEQQPEEVEPFERIGEAPPPISYEEEAPDQIPADDVPFERIGEAPPPISYEEEAPAQPADDVPFERLEGAAPGIEEIPDTQLLEELPNTELMEGPVEDYGTTEDVSVLEPNLAEPPAPTLVYDNETQAQEGADSVATKTASQQEASYDLTETDIEDYTVQTQLQDTEVTTAEEPQSSGEIQAAGAEQNSVTSAFASAGTVEAKDAEETKEVSYTERYKEQDRIIREMAGLPPIEEEEAEPERNYIQEQESGGQREQQGIRSEGLKELAPCPTNPGELIADARLEPVLTAMRFVATGGMGIAAVLLVLHGVAMGIFTGVFTMRLSSLYGYNLGFASYNNGKLILSIVLGIILGIGVYAVMAAVMNFVSQDKTRMGDFASFFRASVLHGLCMVPFLVLGIVLALVNPVFALPVLPAGYGLGTYIMGNSIEGISDFERDEIPGSVFVGLLVNVVGIILLLILLGFLVF